MIKIPYLDIELYIDKKYNIYNSEKEIIHSIKNGLYYSIKIKDRVKIKSLDWIYRFSTYYKDMFCLTPDRLLDVIFIETYIKQGKNILTQIPRTPIPITINNYGILYRLLVTYPRYGISADGIILDTYTGKLKKNTCTDRGYPITALYKSIECKQRLNLRTHRLVALEWVENDNFILKFIVNHKDGNKLNYHYTNLEWCTYSENNKHAVNNNLRNDNKPILIRNINTGDIQSFPSITDACIFIGRSRLSNTHITNIGSGKIVSGSNGMFELKYSDDKTNWVSEYSSDLLISKNQKTRILITYNQESYVINNSEDLINFLKNINISIKIYDYIYEDFRRYSKRVLSRIKGLSFVLEDLDSYSARSSYICRNLITGEETIYTNRIDIANSIKASKSSIQKSIITSGSYVVNNHIVKINDGKPFNKLATISNTPKTIKIIDTNTGSELIFTSLRQTAKYFKMDKKTISNAIENNKILNNKKLIYTK